MQSRANFDAVVVGARFGGIYALHGFANSAVGAWDWRPRSDVGGTWYWNRYPGARCDIESLSYSYSVLARAARASGCGPSATPPSPRSCATSTCRRALRVAPDDPVRHPRGRGDVRRGRRRLAGATDGGDTSLRAASWSWRPAACRSQVVRRSPGLESFRGRDLSDQPLAHERVDFTGQRVGVIGTGSSGIQAIPRSPRRPST